MSDDSYLVLRVQGAGGGIAKAALESNAEHGTSMPSPHVAGVAALWAERQLQRWTWATA